MEQRQDSISKIILPGENLNRSLPEKRSKATASSLKVKGTVKYFIEMYLRHKRNLGTVKLGNRKLLKISRIENDLQEMGIDCMAIDPENFRVYVDPQAVKFPVDLCVEGTDNLFYPFGFNSPMRMAAGGSQGKGIKLSDNPIGAVISKLNKVKKKIGYRYWNGFLAEQNRKEVLSMLKRPPAAEKKKVKVNEQVHALFLSKKFRPLKTCVPVYTDFKTLFIVVSRNFIQFLSWPGYYDLHAPMKLYCKIGSNDIEKVIEFLKDKNYDSRRREYESVPSDKTKENKRKRIDFLKKAIKMKKH